MQAMRYPLLATQLYGTPLLLQPEKAAVIESVFRAWATTGAGPLPDDAAAESRPHCAAQPGARFADKPYLLTEAGVAVIPILGSLVHRGSSLDALSGLQSYARLERQLTALAADADVRGVLLEMDSPGGQAAGVFDLAGRIRALGKPTLAHVNEMALSAGYALAAAAAEVVVAHSGMVGSIGVIALHVDRSKKNARDGYTYTAITAGAKKADASPHAPLSDSARADMQAHVDELYARFIDSVVQMRGLDPVAVRAQEAGVFTGQAGVDAGLADRVASFNDALAAFEDKVGVGRIFSTGGFRQPNGGTTMSAPAQPSAETFSAEQLAAARCEGATAMQERISRIQTCDQARGREKLAAHLAFKTAMNADDAIALLTASPAEAAPAVAPVNALAAGMAKVTNPEIGSGDEPVPASSQAQAGALWERSNARLRAVK